MLKPGPGYNFDIYIRKQKTIENKIPEMINNIFFILDVFVCIGLCCFLLLNLIFLVLILESISCYVMSLVCID